MPAPELPSPAGFASKLSILGLVKDAIQAFVPLEPFQAWFQDTVEKIVPGAAGINATWVLKSRADLMVQMVRHLLVAESAVQPELAKLAALGIEDLFGVPVSAAQLVGRGAPGLRAGGVAPLADAVIKSLFSAVGTSAAVTPQQGYEAMLQLFENQLLMGVEGWLEANLALGLFGADMPGLGDLDDKVASKLGLGRITARAMRPLIDEYILKPSTEYIRQGRQNELPSESLLVRMLFRGIIDETTYFELMARHGWARSRAAEFKLVHAQLPSRADLRALLELKIVDGSGVHEYLVGQGFPPDVASQLVTVIEEDRTRTFRGQLATLARDMFRDREVDEGEFRLLTQRAGLSEDETELLLSLAEIERSRPRRVPQNTMEDLYRRDIVQLGELRGYYEGLGYAPPDVDRLEALAVEEKTEYEERVKKRRPFIPPEAPGAVPRSVALEAHRRGILGEPELRNILSDQGLEGLALDTLLQTATARRLEFVDAEKRRAPVTLGITTSQGTAEEAYVRGIVGDPELRALYQARGFEGRALDVLLTLRAQERADWIRRQLAAQAAAASAATVPRA